MSERLTARSIETIRSLTEAFPYNTFPNMLFAHIEALEAENAQLRAQVKAGEAALRDIDHQVQRKDDAALDDPDSILDNVAYLAQKACATATEGE